MECIDVKLEGIDSIKVYRCSNNMGKDLLLRAAKQCIPLMKKHGLQIGCLQELEHSKNAGLWGLNQNRGQIIYVRLRKCKDVFLEYEHVLGTLLHELVHNTIGPHNAEFKKLLAQYEDEIDALYNAGIYGDDPFLTKGYKLDTSKLFTEECVNRDRLFKAAEKRRVQNMIQGSGVSGGDVGLKSVLTPREAAAIAAMNRYCEKK